MLEPGIGGLLAMCLVVALLWVREIIQERRAGRC